MSDDPTRRRPRAFSVEPEAPPAEPSRPETARRKPRAIAPGPGLEMETED